MRLRPLLVLGTAALLLLTACAPEPAPSPSPTRTPSATPTPTPTPDEVVEPASAFDVSCDDVAAEMAGLVGEPSTPMQPELSVVSGPSWLPGPAQYMFQRAGGIACSAGDLQTQNWEVSIAPRAQSLATGANERGAHWGEAAGCGEGACNVEILEGDVLLSAAIRDPALRSGDEGRVSEALHRLVSNAAASVRDVEYVDSDVVGLPCERLITPQQVAAAAGEDVTLFSDFGGWSIPSEVYQVVNGSRICYYTSVEGNLGTLRSYLMVTTLPAGAWAFEKQEGTPVELAGAEAAKASTNQYGENILDLRVGLDWIRLVTSDNGAGAADPMTYAPTVVQNLTVGVTAPQ